MAIVVQKKSGNILFVDRFGVRKSTAVARLRLYDW